MFWPNTIVETDVFLKKERGTQIVHKSVRKISQFGEVIDVNFSLKNGHPGLVFVELKREDQANLALSSLDGKTHFGRTFSVKFAEPCGAYSARLTAQSNKENQRSPLDRVAKRPTLDKKEHPLSILESKENERLPFEELTLKKVEDKEEEEAILEVKQQLEDARSRTAILEKKVKELEEGVRSSEKARDESKDD